MVADIDDAPSGIDGMEHRGRGAVQIPIMLLQSQLAIDLVIDSNRVHEVAGLAALTDGSGDAIDGLPRPGP